MQKISLLYIIWFQNQKNAQGTLKKCFVMSLPVTEGTPFLSIYV